MAKQDEPFRNISNALQTAWGGGTAIVQNQCEEAQKAVALDLRNPVAEKYDIRDKVASIPEPSEPRTWKYEGSIYHRMLPEFVGPLNPNEVVYSQGNYAQIFNNLERLSLHLTENFDTGVRISMTALRKRLHGPLEVGTLWHPDRVNQRLPMGTHKWHWFLQKTLERTFADSGKEGASEKFLHRLFKSVSGHPIAYRLMDKNNTLGILVPDHLQDLYLRKDLSDQPQLR